MTDSGMSIVAWIAAKFFPGIAGALLIAAYQRPRCWQEWAYRACAAGVGVVAFTMPVSRVFDYYSPWIDLEALSTTDQMLWELPIALVMGTLAWGFLGMLSRLSQIIKARGADVTFERVTRSKASSKEKRRV
jgi:hypothetical protein